MSEGFFCLRFDFITRIKVECVSSVRVFSSFFKYLQYRLGQIMCEVEAKAFKHSRFILVGSSAQKSTANENLV